MKAKVVKRFLDLREDVQREVGDEFTCDSERFKELEKLGFAKAQSHKGRPTKDELVEEVKETKTNPEIAEFLGKEPPAHFRENRKDRKDD